MLRGFATLFVLALYLMIAAPFREAYLMTSEEVRGTLSFVRYVVLAAGLLPAIALSALILLGRRQDQFLIGIVNVMGIGILHIFVTFWSAHTTGLYLMAQSVQVLWVFWLLRYLLSHRETS